MNLHNPLKTFSRPARLFMLATLINGIIFSAWQLFFNFFILAQGYDKAFLGIVNSVPSLTGLAFSIPLGLLTDRIGHRHGMLAGLAFSTLGMGLLVLSSQPALIVMMAFIAGLGNNLYGLSQAPFMMKASDAGNRTLLFSLNFGLQTLAGTVGNLFAGQLPGFFSRLLHVLPGSSASYQAILICSVLLGSISLIPILLIRETSVKPPLEKPERNRGLIQSLRQPLIVRLLLPQLLLGLGASLLIPYMNVFFQEKFGIPDNTLGMLFSLSALLTGISCMIGPRLASRLKSKVQTIAVTQETSLIFLLLIGFAPFAWLSAAGFLVRGALMNMSAPLYTAFAMEQSNPREQGMVNSILVLGWQGGFAVGPLISGLVQDAWGFAPLFIATSILYFFATGLTWVFFHNVEKNQRQAERLAKLG